MTEVKEEVKEVAPVAAAEERPVKKFRKPAKKKVCAFRDV